MKNKIHPRFLCLSNEKIDQYSISNSIDPIVVTGPYVFPCGDGKLI